MILIKWFLALLPYKTRLSLDYLYGTESIKIGSPDVKTLEIIAADQLQLW